MTQTTDRLLTLPEVMRITTKPRTSIYLAVEQGQFPAPRKPGRRLVWLASEIDAWMTSLPRVEFAGRKSSAQA
jgi:predicted DNA-binding transcriptional regulator AlpA